MIHGFPIPYSDEVFYSVVARRASRMNYPSHRAILRELFGSNSVAGTLEVPSHLWTLQNRLPDSHPCASDSLTEGTTFLPWYKPFLPPEAIAQLKQHILHGTGSRSGGRPTKLSGGVPTPRFLRFCPECLREDSRSGRELYWRRLHQLTGIDICPSHLVYLEASQIPRFQVGNWRRFEVPPKALADTAPRAAQGSFLLGVAKLAEESSVC